MKTNTQKNAKIEKVRYEYIRKIKKKNSYKSVI